MGQEYGKLIKDKNQDYFEQQLALYRWRADSSVNTHLSRVLFVSKNKVRNRKLLQNYVNSQLDKQSYVDIQQLTCFSKQHLYKEDEEVMMFENYLTRFSSFNSCLSFEETLHALQILLKAYEILYNKFGKLYIDSECCFITQKGQLRIWINPNPTLSDFPDDCAFCLSEMNSINAILAVAEEATDNKAAFNHFQKQLRFFILRDLLHNTSFSVVRRFINGYVYTHGLQLPNSLVDSVQKFKSPHRLSSSNSQSRTSTNSVCESSSSSQLRLPSTEVNFRNQRSISISQSRQCLTPSHSSISRNSENRQDAFYRSTQPFERKLSDLDFNAANNKPSKRSLNRSQIVNKKNNEDMRQYSFQKKSHFAQGATAPQAEQQATKTRTRIESTIGESYLGHSKDPSGLTVSKLISSQKNMNLYDTLKIQVSHVQRPKAELFKKRQMKTQAHSKQPSFDEQSSQYFVSPANGEVSGPQNGCNDLRNSKFEVIAEEDESIAMFTTRGQMFPSRHINCQTSGLISNKDLNVYQSKGSFHSFENSNASQYRGVLLGFAHSAKLISIPTSKRIERHTLANNK